MASKLDKSKLQVFETVPDLYLILSPDLIILNASNAYLEATFTFREQLIGKHIFEAFPDNPEQVDANGVSKVRSSLEYVLKHKTPHKMEVQRYDVPRPAHLGTGFEEKFWYPIHTPVLNADKEVEYIIQKVVDITKEIQREEEYKSYVKKSAQQIEDVVSVKNQIQVEKEKLYSLFMQAPVIIGVLTGPDHVFELANPKYRELVGINRPIIGKPVREALPELEEQGLFELLDQVYQTKTAFVGNEMPAKLARKATGELEDVFLDLVYQPYLDRAGNTYGILVHAIDVTDQVISRKKVMESEQLVRTVVESSPYPIGVYVGREKLRIQFANQALRDGLGKGNDVIGKSYRALMQELENQQVFEQMDQVFDSGHPLHVKQQRLDMEIAGKVQRFYYNYSLTPLVNSAGEVYGIVNTAADVTDLVVARKEVQESEQRLSLALQATRDGIWDWDFINDKAWWDDRYAEITGAYIPEEERGLQSMSQYIHPEDVDKIKDAFQAHVEKGVEFEVEYRTLHPSGEIRNVVAKGKAVLNEKGKVIRLTGTLSDITALKKAEESLKLKNEQLTIVNNDLDNFIYTASHDLKAPISNLEGLLNALVEEDTIREEQQPLVDRMFQAVERFKHTIKDLTDISKLQRMELQEVELVSFTQILEEVKLDIRELIETFNPMVTTNFKISEIQYSKKNLRSIIYNLVSNALKYSSPDRRAEVHISSYKEKDQIVLQVSDNGLGIIKENQKKIFGMFTRAHHHVEGSGIGLYIVKKIIENRGGKIELESREGKGSTFKIYWKANE
ncbi:hypothetical protein AHMF7605_21815 [Adhaeribacter arboris]|uniref:histidine kinase n=1 Tax=Adhaeribacter arboris TaxID=2072846 RepID=A0A2T2YKD3_9BACT|nr:PAS domain-containing protein [Adhaeribacter arboris]PSR55949.1 hypothetical protein AHMF7605_21815 [Adhaeribacter arboris]